MNKGMVKKRFFTAAGVLACLALCILWLAPFGWVLSTSMRQRSEAFSVPPAFWPEQLNFANYLNVFRAIPIMKFMGNSLYIAIFTTALMLLVTCMAAYSMARISFHGKKLLMPLLLSGMMIPSSVTLIPLFFTMRDLGLINNRWSVILLGIYYPMGFLLIRQFYMTIPKSYDEAAYMDGAGHIRIFFSVILPMSVSSLIVAGLLCFIGSWNNFLLPLILLSNVNEFTIPLGMQFLLGSFSTDICLILAAVVIALIPPVLLFITCQRWLLQGMITTGLKS